LRLKEISTMRKARRRRRRDFTPHVAASDFDARKSRSTALAAHYR
jgi:hypothetical protein